MIVGRKKTKILLQTSKPCTIWTSQNTRESPSKRSQLPNNSKRNRWSCNQNIWIKITRTKIRTKGIRYLCHRFLWTVTIPKVLRIRTLNRRWGPPSTKIPSWCTKTSNSKKIIEAYRMIILPWLERIPKWRKSCSRCRFKCRFMRVGMRS